MSVYSDMLMQRMNLNAQHQNDFADSLSNLGRTLSPLISQRLAVQQRDADANRQLSPAEQFLADIASGRDHHEAFAAAVAAKHGIPNLGTGGVQDTAGLSSYGSLPPASDSSPSTPVGLGGGVTDTVGDQKTSGPAPEAVNDMSVQPSLFRTQRDLDAVKSLAAPINRYDAALMAELGRNTRTDQTEANKNQRSANSIAAKKDIASAANQTRQTIANQVSEDKRRHDALWYQIALDGIKQRADAVIARGGDARDLQMIKSLLDDIKTLRGAATRLRTSLPELAGDPAAQQDAQEFESQLDAKQKELDQMFQRAKAVGSNQPRTSARISVSQPVINPPAAPDNTQLQSLFGK